MASEKTFKNCPKCQGIFSDNKYTTCWACRKTDYEQKLKTKYNKKSIYKTCSGCRNVIKISDYPLSRCPDCLEKIRKQREEKMKIKKTKCAFIDEKSVKCSFGTIFNTLYCKKHNLIFQNNNILIPEVESNESKSDKISDNNNDNEHMIKSLQKVGINRKITDDQIREILKLKEKGLKIFPIIKKTGLQRHHVEEVFHGRIKLLDETSPEEMIKFLTQKHKEEEEKKILKSSMSKDDFQTKINKNQSKKHRKISVEDMIDIMLLKKKILIAVGSKKPRNIFPLETIKIVDPDGSKKITIDMVKNIWLGRAKMYEDDFENQNITFSDYQELLNLDRKSILSDTN